VARKGVDEVLQLEEGTGEVRRGPKGANEGGTGELTEGERNGDTVAQRRRGSGGGGGPIWRAQTQGCRERGRRVMGCSGALASEDESGKKGGGGDEAQFIGDMAGMGDGPRAAPHDGEARRAWGQRGGRAAPLNSRNEIKFESIQMVSNCFKL
jgi:hypothetical protein